MISLYGRHVTLYSLYFQAGDTRLKKGFNAKKASFAEDKLIYEGTLPEREATLR